jgi:hypothetical protein
MPDEIMSITTVPNRNSNPTVLLRESYRKGGKARVRTLANVTHWNKEKVPTRNAVLQGGKVSMDGEFDLLPGRAHGNVHAVLGTMCWLEVENISGSRACAECGIAKALERVVTRFSTIEPNTESERLPETRLGSWRSVSRFPSTA